MEGSPSGLRNTYYGLFYLHIPEDRRLLGSSLHDLEQE